MKPAICLLAYFAVYMFAALFDAVILGKVGEGCEGEGRDFLAD